jgi:hypothetical protein
LSRGKQSVAIVAGPRLRPQRLVLHVAIEQLGDVADAKAVGIGDQRAPFEVHQSRRSEAQRSKALQIVRIPVADEAAAQDRLTFLREARKIGERQDSDVEALGAAVLA